MKRNLMSPLIGADAVDLLAGAGRFTERAEMADCGVVWMASGQACRPDIMVQANVPDVRTAAITTKLRNRNADAYDFAAHANHAASRTLHVYPHFSRHDPRQIFSSGERRTTFLKWGYDRQALYPLPPAASASSAHST